MALAQRSVFQIPQVRKSFTSAHAMYTSKPFRTLLRVWARVAKISNMQLERLLALLKQASPPGSKNNHADVERFCAAGLVTQLMTDHKLRGHFDPRITTREQLFRKCAPISARRASRPSRPASNYALFQAEHTRKGEHQGRNSREEYVRRREQVQLDWSQLPHELKADYTVKAQRDFLAASEEEGSDAAGRSQLGYQTLFSSASSVDFPFTPEAFESVVRDELGTELGRTLPGFRQYSKQFRSKLVETMFVPDDGHPGK